MNDSIDEQLSALVDDELGREEFAFLVRRLPTSDRDLKKVGRYFLIRDALRREIPDSGPIDLVGRVSSALHEEAPLTAVHPRRWVRRALRSVAGVAIAATVAGIAVSLWPVPDSSPTLDTPTAVVSATPDTGSAGGAAIEPVADIQWHQLDPQIQQRLSGYIANHTQHSGSQIGGVMPYARMASYGMGE